MAEIDIQFFSYSCQYSVRSVKQGISGHIVHRSKPFTFEYSPKDFCDIQIRRIWWQEEKKQPSFFQNRSKFPYEFTSVYLDIIQYEESIFLYPERNSIKKICNLVGGDTFSRTESLIAVVTVYHAEYIQSERLLGRDKNILSSELPSIGHISFRAYMASSPK